MLLIYLKHSNPFQNSCAMFFTKKKWFKILLSLAKIGTWTNIARTSQGNGSITHILPFLFDDFKMSQIPFYLSVASLKILYAQI